MYSSRKYPYFTSEGIGISWEWSGGSSQPKHLKKCIKLNWDFQMGGGGGLGKNPFHWGGMDISWNYTINYW